MRKKLGFENQLSWSFNQHVGKIGNRETVSAFITAIIKFGHDKDYREKITHFMGSNGFLTWNYRKDNGKANLWRDYQQYLPDLGLIYSTEVVSSEVRLTPIALMFINGEISFTDLMNTQSLRFQYPNGQKNGMPEWAEEIYRKKGKDLPESVMQVYSDFGIMIRPGLFMLRCLVELAKRGFNAEIDIDETLAFMVNSKTNSEWIYAVEDIIQSRLSGKKPYFNRKVYSPQLRHVSEWFRQMKTTAFCSLYRNKNSLILRLKYVNEEDLDNLSAICDEFDKIPYWMPDLKLTDRQNRLSWFAYYGNADIEAILELESSDTLGILAPHNTGDSVILGNNEKLKVKEIDYRDYVEREYKDVVLNINRYQEGRKRLEESSLLHERIVFELARKLHDAGYSISADALSADLIAQRENEDILFEVKTVTKKKAGHRIRLGVGQLSEYRYRYERQHSRRPESCIVISSEMPVANWYRDYFVTDIKMGLIARTDEDIFSTLIPAPNFRL